MGGRIKSFIFTCIIYTILIITFYFIRINVLKKPEEFITLGFITEVSKTQESGSVIGNFSASKGEISAKKGQIPVPVKEKPKGLTPLEKPGLIGESFEKGRGKGKGFEISGEIAKRKLINFVKPVYPRGENERSVVWIAVVVDSTGYIKNARIVKTGGYKFDESALQAVREWRFLPLNSPKEQKGVVKVTYELK